jgi:hydrogenase expression/formation protein HypC
MCLGVPVKIIEIISESRAIGEIGGIRRWVETSFVDVRVGDYVILHAGFAIQKLDQAEAEETLRLFREMDDGLHS